MASKTLIQLIDDLDGSPATETVTFAVDGVSYEIDLNDANAALLREGVSRWTSIGRVGGRQNRNLQTSARASSNKRDLTAVREWARNTGHKVSDRGRVPQAILDAYDAAN